MTWGLMTLNPNGRLHWWGRDDVGFGGKDPLAGKYTWERNGALDPLDPAPDLPLEVTETINVGKQQVANTYRS